MNWNKINAYYLYAVGMIAFCLGHRNIANTFFLWAIAHVLVTNAYKEE